MNRVGEVTVRIRNRGSEAYMPETFGDVIIIERKISKASNTFKIKSKDGIIGLTQEKLYPPRKMI